MVIRYSPPVSSSHLFPPDLPCISVARGSNLDLPYLAGSDHEAQKKSLMTDKYKIWTNSPRGGKPS